MFRRCEACGETGLADVFVHNHEVCPACGHHGKLSAERWAALLLDEGTFVETDGGLSADDPLEFRDDRGYVERVRTAERASGQREAILTGDGALDGRAVTLGVFVFGFMGGSMGSVVGEKLARQFERSASTGRPAIVLSASGGARMQEGIFSLMQMAKTVAARRLLEERGVPFVSVLLHPTTGGVAASYALLGDVNLAEPGALIGFAGPRVIEQTIRQRLPDGFQRSEFLLEHGMVDRIVPRLSMRSTLARVLDLLVGAG